MPTVMAAHQPNFLPYLGFFDKMKKSDVFVIRDEVQFIERDYHHRNRIRINTNNNGNPQFKWVRVPVNKQPRHLKDIVVKNEVKDKNVPWNLFLLRQIKSYYQHAPFFKDYYPELEEIVLNKKERLIDLNMEIIRYLRRCFNIRSRLIFASELRLQKTNDTSADLVEIAKAVGAESYLSGKGGTAYLNPQLFEREGISVHIQDFTHPVYRQVSSGFIPNLASIDALFCVGNVFDGMLVEKKPTSLIPYSSVRSRPSSSLRVTQAG